LACLESDGPHDKVQTLTNGNGVHTLEIVHESTLAEQLALGFRESDWSTRYTASQLIAFSSRYTDIHYVKYTEKLTVSDKN